MFSAKLVRGRLEIVNISSWKLTLWWRSFQAHSQAQREAYSDQRVEEETYPWQFDQLCWWPPAWLLISKQRQRRDENQLFT